MEKNIEDIRNDAIIEIYSWGGLGPTPGHHSTIITNDKKLYYHHEYYRMNQFLIDSNIPQVYISEGITISDESFKKVIDFIEREIVGKTFKPQCIFDASFTVRGTYQGNKYNIENDIDYENKQGIYDKAKVLFKEIEGEYSNEKSK